MRVLHIFFGKDYAGGAQRSMASLALGLNQLDDCHVIAVVPKTEKHVLCDDLRNGGIEVIECPIPRCVFEMPDRSTLSHLRSYLIRAVKPFVIFAINQFIGMQIKKKKVDLVHIGSSVINEGASPSFRMGIPVVWHLREYGELDWNLIHLNENRAYKYFEKADTCIAVSHSIAGFYKAKNPKINTEVIYNGIVDEDAIDFNSSINKSFSPIKIGFFSGIRTKKGVFTLIGAANHLKQMQISFEICIYGSCGKKEHSRYVEMIDEFGLSNQITYCGWKDVQISDYKQFDLTVVSSKSEAFGRVTAESQAAGVLVVGSDTGGTHELLKDGKGLLFREGDSIDLAEKIAWAVNHRLECEMIRKKAIEFARKQYSTQQYINKVYAVYKRALTGNKIGR